MNELKERDWIRKVLSVGHEGTHTLFLGNLARRIGSLLGIKSSEETAL